MDPMTREISAATCRFYAQHAAAFSGTRQEPWQGWERLVPWLQQLPADPIVLDAACGNLRFERFLREHGIEPAQVFALDECAELLESEGPASMPIQRIQADIISMLSGSSGFAGLGVAPCQLTVAFGFMHHIPSASLRERFLDELLAITAPDGLCILSFWQFGKDARLASKADRVTDRARQMIGISLEETGDHFLGWQDADDAFRFCHDFSDGEIDELKGFAEEHGTSVVGDFCADGKDGDLNRYLVLRRC